jgi:hypothetical protein
MPLPVNSPASQIVQIQAAVTDATTALADIRAKMLAAHAVMPPGTPEADGLATAVNELDLVKQAFVAATVAGQAAAAAAALAEGLEQKLVACDAQLKAANSKLATVPKNADGTLAKPGTYYTIQTLGAVAIGVGLIGALAGYWYKGTTLKKGGGSAKEAAEVGEEDAAEAAEGKKKR